MLQSYFPLMIVTMYMFVFLCVRVYVIFMHYINGGQTYPLDCQSQAVNMIFKSLIISEGATSEINL